jgi:hypothetical protein
MRVVGLALAAVLATTTPMAGHAAGPGSDMRPADRGPASNIVLVWDGGGSGGHSGAIGAQRAPGRAPQWNGGAGVADWRQNRQYGSWGFYSGPVPTYWVWVPGSAVFDYPFADWRGPTGGWGNP